MAVIYKSDPAVKPNRPGYKPLQFPECEEKQ